MVTLAYWIFLTVGHEGFSFHFLVSTLDEQTGDRHTDAVAISHTSDNEHECDRERERENPGVEVPY